MTPEEKHDYYLYIYRNNAPRTHEWVRYSEGFQLASGYFETEQEKEAEGKLKFAAMDQAVQETLAAGKEFQCKYFDHGVKYHSVFSTKDLDKLLSFAKEASKGVSACLKEFFFDDLAEYVMATDISNPTPEFKEKFKEKIMKTKNAK